MKRLLATSIALAASSSCFAQGSAWLPEPGQTTLNLSFVHQTADDLYAGERKMKLDDDLNQNTYWLQATYGLSDAIALDGKIGFAESDYGPQTPRSLDGVTDSSIGITWRFLDEFTSDEMLPSAALRVGAVLQGNYDTGTVHSIGDGADAIEASIILGRIISHDFALSGEIRYRFRNSGTPDEALYKIGAHYSVIPSLVASVDYSVVNATSGSSIGQAGFQFPGLQEDVEAVNVGLRYGISSQLSAGLNYAAVLDGKNTANHDVYGLNLGFSF